MPDSANPLLTAARVAAKQSAQALRLGAAVLDHLGGGGQAPEEAGGPQPEPTAARAKRGGAAAKPRAGRQASNRPKDLDDATIARKVETIIFRDGSVPKGDVDVNVADGVVFLRGQVKHPDDVKGIEEQARAIPEVKGVENLLHLPKTPAATRTDTPEHQRKPAGRRTRPNSAQVHLEPEGVNAEIPVPGAEPGPAEHAREHTGRAPAPMGSHGPAGTEGSGS